MPSPRIAQCQATLHDIRARGLKSLALKLMRSRQNHLNSQHNNQELKDKVYRSQAEAQCLNLLNAEERVVIIILG